MKTSIAVAVWLYLVVATVIEVALYKVSPGNLNIDIGISLVAAVSAIITVMFSMDLKDESTAIKYLFLIPVLLVAVLIITLLLAFPLIQ